MISKNRNINGAFFKAIGVLDPSINTMVSVSGGSDSDILVDFVTRSLNNIDNVHFVFFNTGLELDATKNHIDYLEERYNIEIERLRPKESIVTSIKKNGIPFLSKVVSENISRLQKIKFDFTDTRDFDELYKDYGAQQSALKWYSNYYKGTTGLFNIDRNPGLKEYLVKNPPGFNISSKCCKYSKKDVSADYIKKNDIELMLMGVRRAEGGARQVAYKSCYYQKENYSVYAPLLWFTDQDKQQYNRDYNIKNSDCYTKYGFVRTGCAGCPFNLEFEKEYNIIRRFEPKLSKAISNVFGRSYDYTNEYRSYRKFGKIAKTKQLELDSFE